MGVGRESVESHRVVEVNANGWPRFQNKLLWCSRSKELVNRIDLCNSTAMLEHKRFKSGTALRESFEKRVDIITLQHLSVENREIEARSVERKETQVIYLCTV